MGGAKHSESGTLVDSLKVNTPLTSLRTNALLAMHKSKY